MKTLDKEGKAVIELTVEWQNGGVHYTDSLWADPVNLWRDYLLPDLATALAGKNQGDTVTIPVPKNSFHAPYQTNRLVQVGGTRCIILRDIRKPWNWSMAAITPKAICME